MNRVSAVTITREDGLPVIHGEGDCMEFMYNVVKGEMIKMDERYKNELALVRSELKTARSTKSKLRAKDLEEWHADIEKKPSLLVRSANAIETAWCVFFATLMELGLIKNVGSGKQDI